MWSGSSKVKAWKHLLKKKSIWRHVRAAYVLISGVFIRREISTEDVWDLHVSRGWVLFSAEVMKMLKLLLSHSEQVFNYLPVNFNSAQHLCPSSGLFQTSAVEVSENSRHTLYNIVKLIGHMNVWVNAIKPAVLCRDADVKWLLPSLAFGSLFSLWFVFIS